MFTGIIETLGTVERLDAAAKGGAEGARLIIAAGPLLEGVGVGDSIAVDGVCLTVTALRSHSFTADVSLETLRRSTLGDLRVGDHVNLERPMRLDQRLGGHIVQGHVDGVGTVTAARPEGDGVWMEIAPPASLLPFLAEKGSVAVDGVSLTIAGLSRDAFAVALIPHTLAVTTLGRRQTGGRVNIEVDILAKYVQRLLEGARGA
jgi:riboflavin synthase